MSSISISRDSRSLFGVARDQGARPTCLALALSDAHAAIRGPWEPLSAEYLYYHAKRREGGLPTPGATVPSIRLAMQEDGQPIESSWPYSPTAPTDMRAWKPPAEVGDVFRRNSERLGDGFEQAWDMAQRGEPALIVMRLSDAFYTPSFDGIVDSKEPADPARRHAVVAAAAAERSGTRLVLVRNSWGASWGISGYAWITEGYMIPRIIQIIALREAA